MKKTPSFSIILPIYNQKKELHQIISTYTKALDQTKWTYELLFIINSDQDGSYREALKYSQKLKNVRVYKINKSGWGRAVITGLKKSTGKYLCYTNSARTNVNDLIKILAYSQINDQTIIKASRIIRDSNFRKISSTIFNLEARFLLKIPVWDINGTPKVIPRNIASKLSITSTNDLIDLEVLYKCFISGFDILEIPVRFTKRRKGKSTTNIMSGIKIYLGTFLFYLKQTLA